MRVALVHDYLDQFGCQESVLFQLMKLFPEAPIYTLLYEPRTLGKYLNGREIKTSVLNNPLVRRYHRLFIPVLGHAAQTLNLKNQYDLIITNTMGLVKGVRYQSGIHIAYNHTPLRYAWEPQTYLGDMFPKFMIYAGMPAIRYMRWQDKRFSKRPDYMLANSKHTASKIKEFYGREATVITPPIEDHAFNFDPTVKKQNYFLAFGRIIHYKKFPLIVRAFKELGLPLKIVGSGPDERTLRKEAMGASNIELFPFTRTDQDLRDIIRGARATIVPQLEDFGLSTVESIACGTPVIGYNRGGTAEIVQNGVSGLLFDSQTEEGLVDAVRKFETMQFKPKIVADTAKIYSTENFRNNFMGIVESALKKN